MKARLLLATLALIAVFAVSFASNTGVASAHPAETQITSMANGTQCKTVSPVIHRLAKPVTTFFNVGICYDGSKVWTTRVDCNLYAIGGSGTNSWCGTSTNNSSHIEFGNNYQFAPWGSWFQIFGYNRFQYDAHGNYMTNYGN